MQSEFVLEMKGISKEYFGNPVLKDVSIRVRPGEIMALVGENGAGKSTLMNILFGMPTIHSTNGFKGEIRIDGETVQISSPLDAMRHGIGMVHQEFMLIDDYEIAENVKLNRENLKQGVLRKLFGDKAGVLDRRAMKEETAATLDEVGLNIDAATHTGSLPVGYKQFIEIARELDKTHVRLIVLDEPTAVLTENEAEKFLQCVQEVTKKGISFIFISHRLNEVKNYANHMAILRDGSLVGEYDTQDVSVRKISELMIGRSVDISQLEEERKLSEEVILELKDFSVDMPGEFLKNASVQIHKGEIFGFAGLAGHGKAAVANGIMGLYPSSGEVILNGEPLNASDTLATLSKSVAFVSEDRRGVGLLLDESIEMNVVISALRVKNQFLKKIAGIRFYDKKAGRKYAEEMIQEFDIRCTGASQHTRSLSGGNQQKVCIARAMTLKPEVLLVSEPTRGIDVGAKKRILDALTEMNKSTGAAIIITSSELAELRSICDRIAIVTEGEITGILKPSDEDYRYGLLMSGVSEEEGGCESCM